MNRKTPKQHEQDLKHKQQLTEIAKDQIERQQEIEAHEAFEVSGYTANRDLANQLLGHIQMASAFAKLATVASYSKLAYIKENKLYQSLDSMKVKTPEGAELATVATWDGFCQAIGMSRRMVDEHIQNLHEFGEEAYDAMTRAGVGMRTFRQLRKLPDEARQLMINGEAVRLDDKEEVNACIEDLVERHAKEVNGLKGDLEASRENAKKKNLKIDELEMQLHKRESLPIAERAAVLSKQFDDSIREATNALGKPSRIIAEILDWDDAPRELRHACAQGVGLVRIALDRIQQHHALPVVELDFDDSWMDQVIEPSQE